MYKGYYCFVLLIIIIFAYIFQFYIVSGKREYTKKILGGVNVTSQKDAIDRAGKKKFRGLFRNHSYNYGNSSHHKHIYVKPIYFMAQNQLKNREPLLFVFKRKIKFTGSDKRQVVPKLYQVTKRIAHSQTKQSKVHFLSHHPQSIRTFFFFLFLSFSFSSSLPSHFCLSLSPLFFIFIFFFFFFGQQKTL